MSKRDDILDGAERLFHRDGFHATGIDGIVAAASVTPRTLYRHFRSKEALVQAVLERRESRFLAHLDAALARPDQDAAGAGPWLHLFGCMERWFDDEGALGCMFLKALGEYGHHDAIAQLVIRHKRRVLREFRRRIASSALAADPGLADSLALVLEGAVALAPVIGGRAAARHATDTATRLLRGAAPSNPLH